jgi:hypothetical protein
LNVNIVNIGFHVSLRLYHMNVFILERIHLSVSIAKRGLQLDFILQNMNISYWGGTIWVSVLWEEV